MKFCLEYIPCSINQLKMLNQASTSGELSWDELNELTKDEADRINGINNSYSKLRLFNLSKESVRVTLYRDHHAWCPYCQKVWLWLEWKKIPYKIKKVTMRCYGEKEKWYLKKVPSGMFPAIELDENLITESDQIVFALEKLFGPLGMNMNPPQIINLRNLCKLIQQVNMRTSCKL